MGLSLHVLVVLQCIAFSVFCYSVLVFFPFLLTSYYCYYLLVLLWFLFLHWTLSSVWWVFWLGLGVAGGARGWVAGRAGLWEVLATWVRGWRLHSLGSTCRHLTSMCDSGINLPITCEIFYHLLLVFSTKTAKPSLCFFAWFLCILFQFGGVSDRTVNTLNSRSGGPGTWVQSLPVELMP